MFNMTDPIVMLTKGDLTIPDAVKVFHSIKDTGISHIGFKDRGLPPEGLKELAQTVKKENIKIYFEIISHTKEDTLQSAEKALELGADYLIGGKFVQDVLPVVKNRIKYYPYAGKVVGHPCMLEGEIEEIVDEAVEFMASGADGINLLAYRYQGSPEQLITALQKAGLPLIVAGNIDSPERIRFLTRLNISAFTIGTALFDKKFAPRKSLNEQIKFVLSEVKA
jgi:hypothetical protein